MPSYGRASHAGSSATALGPRNASRSAASASASRGPGATAMTGGSSAVATAAATKSSPGLGPRHDRPGALQQEPLERLRGDQRLHELPQSDIRIPPDNTNSPGREATGRSEAVYGAGGWGRSVRSRAGGSARPGPGRRPRIAASASRWRRWPRAESHRVKSLGGEGLGDVVALCLVAAEVGQPVERLAVLDALGHDPQAEVAAEVDGGAHDHGVVRVDVHRSRRTGRS